MRQFDILVLTVLVVSPLLLVIVDCIYMVLFRSSLLG
jgi:hypothetical protein